MEHLKKFAIALVALVAIGGSIASGSSSTDDGASSGDTGSSAEGGSGTTEKDPGTADEVDDVEVTKCAIDDITNWPEATLKVTNDSEKPSDYYIEVTFESKDGSTQFGTGFTAISNLKPGQSKTEKVSALEEAEGKIVCTVSSVERTESI